MSKIEDLTEVAPCGIAIHYTVDNDTDFVTYNDINGRGKYSNKCPGCSWYGLCNPAMPIPKSCGRIYISGAITGTVNYMERFEAAEKELTEQGYTVINPAKVNAQLPAGSTTYEDYMRMSLFLMDMCDVLYQLDGWEYSKGANRELGYALGKDMTIFQEGDLKDEQKNTLQG
jgi:hypothetical protein